MDASGGPPAPPSTTMSDGGGDAGPDAAGAVGVCGEEIVYASDKYAGATFGATKLLFFNSGQPCASCPDIGYLELEATTLAPMSQGTLPGALPLYDGDTRWFERNNASGLSFFKGDVSTAVFHPAGTVAAIGAVGGYWYRRPHPTPCSRLSVTSASM